MAAVHQLPVQLYDNCLTLVGSGSRANNTAGQSRQKDTKSNLGQTNGQGSSRNSGQNNSSGPGNGQTRLSSTNPVSPPRESRTSQPSRRQNRLLEDCGGLNTANGFTSVRRR